MTEPKVSEKAILGLLEKMWREFVAQYKDEDLETYKEELELYRALRSLITEQGRRRLSKEQADEIEAETHRLEADPTIDKHAFRLHLEHPMPCGHATANLLMCEEPPYGCVICGPPDESDFKLGGEEGKT